MRTLIVSLLLALLTLSNTACIGRMAVSGKVRAFNLDVTENRFGRELVFLCLYVIPVYPIAGAIDLIIVNSIEFWTGENPVNGEPRLARIGGQKYVVAPDGSEAISTLRADGSMDLELRTPDGGAHFVNLVREDGQFVARDDHGQRLARLDGSTGRIEPIEGAPRAH